MEIKIEYPDYNVRTIPANNPDNFVVEVTLRGGVFLLTKDEALWLRKSFDVLAIKP